MEKCKTINEKIIFFEELSDDEKKDVQKHLKTCSECREVFGQIQIILSNLMAMGDQNHIDDAVLVRYITYKNNPNETDYDGTKLVEPEVANIQKHLQECALCQEKINEKQSEYDSIETYLDEMDLPDVEIKVHSEKIQSKRNISSPVNIFEKLWKNLFDVRKPKYVYALASVFVILFLIILILPIFKGSPNIYYEIALLEKSKVTFLTRGANVSPVREGLFEFNEGNYSASIEILENYVTEQPDNPNRAFAEYICGISYLFRVNDLLVDNLKIPDYDIDKGIKHLENSLSRSSNLRIQEDANWYIAKAYLIKKNGQKAKEYFEKTASLKGRKYQKAQNILSELRNILTPSK